MSRTGIPQIDPDGRRFESISAMCEAHGTTIRRYQNRLKSGMTKAQALDPRPIAEVRGTWEGPDGRTYGTQKEMLEAAGISGPTYRRRRRNSESETDAIQKKSRPRASTLAPELRTAPDGREFPTEKAMCEACGIPLSRYKRRREAGCTIAQALDPRPIGIVLGRFKGPDGREFPSESAMCEAYGVERTLYRRKRKAGYTVEQALGLRQSATPPRDAKKPGETACAPGKRAERQRAPQTPAVPGHKRGRKNECIAPDGRIFRTEGEMADAYGVKRRNYFARKNAGHPVEKCLSTEPLNTGKTVYDHDGKAYPNFTAMCAAYGRDPSVTKRRLASGSNLEQALTGDPHGTAVWKGRKFRDKGKACAFWMKKLANVKSRMAKYGTDFEDELERLSPLAELYGVDLSYDGEISGFAMLRDAAGTIVVRMDILFPFLRARWCEIRFAEGRLPGITSLERIGFAEFLADGGKISADDLMYGALCTGKS